MSGKVYVAYVENYDYSVGDFMGVFSTAKRAKAAFGNDNVWESVKGGGKTTYVSHHFNDGFDFIVYKTKIDDVIGYSQCSS